MSTQDFEYFYETFTAGDAKLHRYPDPARTPLQDVVVFINDCYDLTTLKYLEEVTISGLGNDHPIIGHIERRRGEIDLYILRRILIKK